MKKQIILGLSLLAFGILQAQKNQQYLHFNMGGGLNNLSYQLSDGAQKGQAGFTINAAYSYFFNPNWGLQTGIGLQSFGALGTVNLLTKEFKIDQDGDNYELRTNYNNWQEKENTLFLEIPLVGQYRYALSQKFKLLASAGVKVGIPMNTSYKTTGGVIQTTGYYSQWNVELSDLPNQGFYTIHTSHKGNYSMKTTGMAIADLGALYKITDKADLYLGAYFNYGLTNVLTPDNQLIFEQNGKYNGIFKSNQTSSITPISLGLKVGIYWQLDKAKQTARAIPIVETVPIVKLGGKISNLKTNAPTLATIDISSDGQKIKTIETDENGQFNIDLPKGKIYHLIITSPNYTTQNQTVDLTTSDLEVQKDITLVRIIRDIELTAKCINTKTNAPVNATMEIKSNDKLIQTLKADSAGIIKMILPEGKIYKIEISAPEYELLSKTEDLSNGIPEREEQVVLYSMSKIVKEYLFDNIHFESGKDNLTNRSIKILNEVVKVLNDNPDLQIEISGHTDNYGSAKSNMYFSKIRAKSAAGYLIHKGTRSTQIKTLFFGLKMPVATNKTNAGKALNRRVELKIIK